MSSGWTAWTGMFAAPGMDPITVSCSGTCAWSFRSRAHLLAASEVQTARKLLWEALAASEGDTLINCITTANEWAVDVGLAARLDIGQEGYLGVRGMQPPVPYLASGHFL
jgi:hypothetical protein